MHFVHVKDQIQLANIFETSVQNLNKNLENKNQGEKGLLTCIRSKIPSSDSDESTQKMKYKVA